MTVLSIKELPRKPSFLSRLWQGVLRFDEALNFDPRIASPEDVTFARRI
jgi:hypothetical protein